MEKDTRNINCAATGPLAAAKLDLLLDILSCVVPNISVSQKWNPAGWVS